MPLIKNKKGVIVAVDAARKAYLLNPKPVALKTDGSPKTDANGKTFPVLKAEHEIGWTDVTAAEEAAYNEELEEAQESAQKVTQAQEAAGLVAVAAAMGAKKAVEADHANATGKNKAGRKSKAQKAAEAEAEAKLKEEKEAKVRDAEGDKEKYDALSDDEKAMYADLGLEEVTE